MDLLIKAKVGNTISEIENVILKKYEDIPTLHFLLNRSSNHLHLLLTHVAYLESKLLEFQAENQRLSQIAKY